MIGAMRATLGKSFLETFFLCEKKMFPVSLRFLAAFGNMESIWDFLKKLVFVLYSRANSMGSKWSRNFFYF